MLKSKIVSLISAAIIICGPVVVEAHVIVTPSHANVGQELTFSVSVPNEQQTPVTGLKLDIPANVTNVIPTVKQGWNIQTTQSGSSSSPSISAITWSAGSIPVGERDDFSFSAQVPGSPTEIDWKAYQTYADGTVVHWDQKPAGSDDSVGNSGPYSVTKIVNDLAAKSASAPSSNVLPLVLSLIAIILTTGLLLFRKK